MCSTILFTSPIMGVEEHKKGILKHQRTYSNKHVDFNLDVEFVPFDESKDYTIEIQIVEQMPKKIVSYAALFAQQALKEQTKQPEDKLEKNSNSKKHCVNCKSKKERKQKQVSGLSTVAVKDVNMDEGKEHENIKKSEECLPTEDVTNDTLDNIPSENQPSEGEAVLCEDDKDKEETVEAGVACDCRDENGDHNEIDCKDCQNAKLEKLQVESRIDNEGESKDSSVDQVKRHKPHYTELLRELGKDNEQYTTNTRKETEEGHDLGKTTGANEEVIKTNLELIDFSRYDNEQPDFEEVLSAEEVKHSKESHLGEDEIRDEEETVARDENLKSQVEEDERDNKYDSNDQNEKDDEISDDYYDTEANLNTHTSQNETEENTLSYSNEIQSDDSICEDSKEFEEIPIPIDVVQNTSVPSNVKDNCIKPRSELDQQCNECVSTDARISEEVNKNPALREDLEINDNQQNKSKIPLDVPVHNPKEEDTDIIKLDETSDSGILDNLNSIHSHSCPAKGEASNEHLNVGELSTNELSLQTISNESENEVGKGDYIDQNDSNFLGSNKQLESLDEQQENQNLLECLPESVAGDGQVSIKLDENGIPNQTSFCKMEAVGSSNCEINNSR